jgi:thymidylate kinase
VPEFIPTHQLESRKVERGTIGATARMLNRLAEHWFRQMIAWSYQWRGYIVLYDRHFLFEFATRSIDTHRYNLRLSDRFHLWCVHHLYPRPDLVIFLDAPPEVLLSRKGEWATEHLERHSLALLEQGKNMANFIRVDATQPLDKVYADVSEHILRFATST